MFSTTTGWPSRGDSRSATKRAMMSGPVPRRERHDSGIGWSGQAKAALGSKGAAVRPARRGKTRRRFMALLPAGLGRHFGDHHAVDARGELADMAADAGIVFAGNAVRPHPGRQMLPRLDGVFLLPAYSSESRQITSA